MSTLDPVFETMVRRHLLRFDPGAPISPDLILRDAGVDSLALIELLVSVEDTYDVEFPDELLVPETFRTPASLWSVISELRGRTGAAA